MLFFDIETDGLLEDLTRIHCMCIYDDVEKKMYRYTPDTVEDGIRKLMAGMSDTIICGHNIISFDIPAIHKLYPWFEVDKSKVIDTLVYARLVFSEINYIDNKLTRIGVLPKRLYGSHSLKAYGYRLGVLKGTYCEEEDAWACFNPEMLDYNEQDVVVTEALYRKCAKKTTSEQALSLEHKAQWLMVKMEQNGFTFDTEKALVLLHELQERQNEVIQQISEMVPRIPDKVFVPKRDNKKMGYKAGVPIQRYKEFNPNSRQQVLWIMKDYYKYPFSNPDMHNEDGKIQLNEETFKLIVKDTEAPEEVRKLAELFQENFLLTKRLGQLIDGKNGWLKLVSEDGKIHGHVNPNGAITGRATHSKPNIAQVPHVGTEYGKECRELFTVPKGWYQAGIDACGLELRCLSHYLYPFDNGEYANECVNGDIHTKNQIAAGLPERNMAKTFNNIDVYKLIENGGNPPKGQYRAKLDRR